MFEGLESQARVDVINEKDAVTFSIEFRRQRTKFVITICVPENESDSVVIDCDGDSRLFES